MLNRTLFMKGLAVPYVIALILGVVVIAFLGIWFVSTGGKFSREASIIDCKNAVILYCTRLLNGEQIGVGVYQKECEDINKAGIFKTNFPSNVDTCKSQGWIT